MAKLIGLFRLGRDGETRYRDNGDPILELSLAFDYGRGDNKQSQWVKAAMFGDRAEKVAEYMKKGKLIYAEIDGPHVKTFDKSDGTQGVALEGVLAHFEFASKKDG
jgi:single-strand DNA-binding protein